MAAIFPAAAADCAARTGRGDPLRWHLITGEYPPQPGGVSAYTRQVARGLAAAGDEVTVWSPPVASADVRERGITVRRLPDRFGRRSFRALDEALGRPAADQRMLVQYVPHAFGWKGANIPFCRWVASRPRTALWVMFHEVAFPFDARQSPLRNALAAANRVMARRIARSATRVFVSIPAWRPMIESLAGAEIQTEWLPVPSGIEVSGDASRAAAIRARIGAGHPIVGHFGTHGAAIRDLLADAVPVLLERTECRLLLIGPRGAELRDRLVAADRRCDARVFSTGALTEAEVSAHIAACDVMLQPYPDGISSRRTSAMAALAHGVAVVSTVGWLTEPLWRTSESVALADVGDAVALATETERLLACDEVRSRIAVDGRRLYEARFDLRHTIAALRGASVPAATPVCA